MGTVTKKLGCAASLFQCFSSSKKKKHADNDEATNTNGSAQRSAINVTHANGAKQNGTRRHQKKVTINAPAPPQSSPILSSDIQSVSGSMVSGRSSAYYDADDWEIASDLDDSSSSLDEFHETIQIDGQFFFSAEDDHKISQAQFRGIKMYPPQRTTKVDPTPLRSPVSVSNMQTLLHTYQHPDDDGEKSQRSQRSFEAAEKAGAVLERSTQRLYSLSKEELPDYFQNSTALLLKELEMPDVTVREPGFPGELTEEELEAVKLFQSELQTRDQIYNQIVRSFSSVEKEAYALCRFLRARKFDVEKVFELLDEAREFYVEALADDFYPDLEAALGFPRSVFLSQYPAIFNGNAKNGCPVMYLRAGMIQPEGIKCLVPVEKISKFFWNDVVYGLTSMLKQGRTLNPNFVRTENISVYDLAGVSRSQITTDTFDVIKQGNRVMASFPETLHCLLIINAPGWFGFVWSAIRKFIDPRTASKIEVFTNAKAGSARMRELIDESQIPSDYDGSGSSLAQAAAGAVGSASSCTSPKIVAVNHLLTLTKKHNERSYDFQVEDSKQLTLTINTRCKTGATAALFRDGTLVSQANVLGEEADVPYIRTLGAVKGPGNFKVKLKSKSDPGVYLVIGTTSASDD